MMKASVMFCLLSLATATPSSQQGNGLCSQVYLMHQYCVTQMCPTSTGVVNYTAIEEKITAKYLGLEARIDERFERLKRTVVERLEGCEETRARCPLTSLTFPREDEIEDYILYNGSTVPQLTDVSICAWFTPPNEKAIGVGGVLSYYKYESKKGNTLLIFFDTDKQISLSIHDIVVLWKIEQVKNRTHFCFLISTLKRKAEIFRNGVSLGQKNLPSSRAVPAGGAMIIGNDQDRSKNPDAFIGSMEDASQTFTGVIENLYIWCRTLGEDEIEKLHSDPCSCPSDHIIALTEGNVENHGQVKVASHGNDCT